MTRIEFGIPELQCLVGLNKAPCGSSNCEGPKRSSGARKTFVEDMS